MTPLWRGCWYSLYVHPYTLYFKYSYHIQSSDKLFYPDGFYPDGIDIYFSAAFIRYDKLLEGYNFNSITVSSNTKIKMEDSNVINELKAEFL